MNKAHLVLMLVSAVDELTVLRVQPASGSAADSVDILIDHENLHADTMITVEPNPALLPGIFSGPHLLSVVLPALYAKWGGDDETYADVLSRGPIDIEVPLADFAGV